MAQISFLILRGFLPFLWVLLLYSVSCCLWMDGLLCLPSRSLSTEAPDLDVLC